MPQLNNNNSRPQFWLFPDQVTSCFNLRLGRVVAKSRDVTAYKGTISDWQTTNNKKKRGRVNRQTIERVCHSDLDSYQHHLPLKLIRQIFSAGAVGEATIEQKSRTRGNSANMKKPAFAFVAKASGTSG